MSDTPRTNAESQHREGLGLASGKVCSDFARQLERELNSATADLVVMQARVAAMQRDLAGKTRERDKSRRESCVLESMLRFSKTHPKETVSMVAILRLAQEIAVEMEWDCFLEEEER